MEPAGEARSTQRYQGRRRSAMSPTTQAPKSNDITATAIATGNGSAATVGTAFATVAVDGAVFAAVGVDGSPPACTVTTGAGTTCCCAGSLVGAGLAEAAGVNTGEDCFAALVPAAFTARTDAK